MIDPRLISAAALFWIGSVLLWFIIRVWFTHPINRVFALGEYVTELGLRILLRNGTTLFVIGLFFLTAAAAKVAYALRWAKQEGSGELADFFGAAEAAFALWAACCVTIAAWRLCRKR